MKSVLFVDDEPNILSGIRRMLRPYRDSFNFEFAERGETALELMEQQHFDVLVSDMRMPGMNGIELLTISKERYPETIRLALSGHAEVEMELECAQIAHQFLAKPIAAEALVTKLGAALALQSALTHGHLRTTLSGASSLPSLPDLYQKILNEAASPEGSLENIGNIISCDVAMTAKILQLVNSAFFGLSRHVASPSEAATILGLDILKSLVLSNAVFNAFSDAGNTLDLEQLTNFSQQVAIVAREIATFEELPKKQCDLAMMCGMLHQCGKLILASHLKLSYQNDASEPHWQWEREQTGITHAEAGAYLLGIWGLPNPLIEAVLFYIKPSKHNPRELSALTITHIASALVSNLANGEISDQLETTLDMGYLQQLDIADHIDDWKKLALETLCSQESKPNE